MKLLVTGGDGFIGSNFILHTLKNFPKYEIINLDAGFYGSNKLSLDEISGWSIIMTFDVFRITSSAISIL